MDSFRESNLLVIRLWGRREAISSDVIGRRDPFLYVVYGITRNAFKLLTPPSTSFRLHPIQVSFFHNRFSSSVATLGPSTLTTRKKRQICCMQQI